MSSTAIMGNMPVEVLNASYQKLAPTTLARAFALVFSGQAVFEEEDDTRIIRHATGEYFLPKVIRLLKMLKVNVVYTEVTFNKTELLKRDNKTCGYCRKPATTHDHIIPRSQGGKDEWMNAVAACLSCNSKKANRTPAEAGMKLLMTPFVPRDYYFVSEKKRRPKKVKN